MSLLRRRAPHRSCPVHGDNGCEIQGEAGTRERHHDKRAWRRDIEDEFAVWADEASEWAQLGAQTLGDTIWTSLSDSKSS